MSTDESQASAQAAFGAPASGRRPPSRAGYWLGGALIAAGIAGAIVWLVTGLVGFSNAVDDLARVRIPGTGVVSLTQGSKAVYYEGGDAGSSSSSDSSSSEDVDVPPLRIVIRPASGGASLAIGGHSGSVSYSMGGHSGQSVASVKVPRDGRYRVSVSAPRGADPGAELAIGRGLGSRLVRAILGAIAIFLLGGVGGTVVIVVTSSRRSRASS